MCWIYWCKLEFKNLANYTTKFIVVVFFIQNKEKLVYLMVRKHLLWLFEKQSIQFIDTYCKQWKFSEFFSFSHNSTYKVKEAYVISFDKLDSSVKLVNTVLNSRGKFFGWLHINVANTFSYSVHFNNVLKGIPLHYKTLKRRKRGGGGYNLVLHFCNDKYSESQSSKAFTHFNSIF